MNKDSKTKVEKMVKNDDFRRDNRGIALITIIIAVAFVSIIGSALLYITYTNFQMKVLNLGSKQNYYEADGELLDFSNAIRDIADKPASIEALISGDQINLANALAMIGAAGGTKSEGGDVYTYTTTATVVQDPIVNNCSTYHIKDIYVKQVSKEGYVNKVRTDLEVKILQQTKADNGKKGVGECSMISDSSMSMTSSYWEIDWTGITNSGYVVDWSLPEDVRYGPYRTKKTGSASQFDFMTMFGDAYYSSYYYGASGNQFGTFNGSGTYTMPGQYGVGDPALVLATEAKLNFESDYMAVYGDLVLTDKSSLVISKGNLTVYGDIYVLGSASLICNGTIYQPEHILPGRTKECSIYSDSGEITPAHSDWNKHIKYSKAVEKVTDDSFNSFCTLLKLDDDNKDNDGITTQISSDLKYWDKDKKKYTTVDVLNTISNIPDGTTDGKINSKYYDIDCGIAFANAGAQVGNVDAYQNYILFVTNGNSGSVLEVRGSSVNTTLVSSSPIHLSINSGVYYSKMGSAIYDYLTVKDSTNAYYNEGIHKVYLGFAGKDNDGNNINSGGSAADKDKNRFSAGDMLADDANPKIIQLFTAGINGGAGVPTYINSISFDNYVKDAN